MTQQGTRTASQRPLTALWLVTYPLLITSFAQVSLTIVDTALLGRVSTRALASVGLAAPVYLVGTMLARGWASATQILVAQRHGAGARADAGDVARVGLTASVLAGGGVGVLLFVLAPVLLRAIGADADLVGPGVAYLRIVACAVPFAAAGFALQGACSGVGATRVAMFTAFVINAVDIPLGLVLIFGFRLGVVGAALSTLAGIVAGAAYLLWYARTRLGMPRWEGATNWPALLPKLWAISWPETTTLFVGYVNEVILIAFVARLGTVSIAVYRLLESVTLMTFTIMTVCASGVSILAGQRLGAGEPDQAAVYRRAGLGLAAMLAAVPTVPILVNPRLVLRLFTADPDVITATASITLLAVIALVPMLFAQNLAGILRASGDSRTVMTASLTSDYLVLVPFAWLLALPLGLGLHGIFLAWLGFALSFLAILSHRYRQGAWRASRL